MLECVAGTNMTAVSYISCPGGYRRYMGQSQLISMAGYIPRLFGSRGGLQPKTRPSKKPSSRRWVGPAVRLAVSVALVGWVCRRIDAADFARQFLAQSPSWLF